MLSLVASAVAIGVARPTFGGYSAVERLRQLFFFGRRQYLCWHRIPPKAGLVVRSGRNHHLGLAYAARPIASGLDLLASRHGTSGC